MRRLVKSESAVNHRSHHKGGAALTFSTYIAVLIGGAIGTGFRYGLSSFVYSVVTQPTFPYANLIINVSGSFMIGFLAELFDTRVLVSPVLRVALLTGLLGGYTTFSSFAYETYSLARDGELGRAILNVAASLVLGLIAVWLGVRLAGAL
jgi:fluoride exporter